MKLFKAEHQLESLRYQINPHFFMNTLNNIHALVDIDPEKAKESFVKIAVVIDAGRIIFRCINSKSSAAPGDGKGLGQENTRRRFELLYGEAYTLHIDDMPDRYEVFLVLPMDSPPLVVFTTAYSEHAVEGFRVDAVDYLLKPFSLADFMKTAERVKARWEALQVLSQPAVSTEPADDSLFFRTDYKSVRVKPEDGTVLPVGDAYRQGLKDYLDRHSF